MFGWKSIMSVIEYVDEPERLMVFTASDWAGCLMARRYESCGVIMYGSRCLSTWSSNLVSPALSSAEAVYNAMVT